MNENEVRKAAHEGQTLCANRFLIAVELRIAKPMSYHDPESNLHTDWYYHISFHCRKTGRVLSSSMCTWEAAWKGYENPAKYLKETAERLRRYRDFEGLSTKW